MWRPRSNNRRIIDRTHSAQVFVWLVGKLRQSCIYFVSAGLAERFAERLTGRNVLAQHGAQSDNIPANCNRWQEWPTVISCRTEVKLMRSPASMNPFTSIPPRNDAVRPHGLGVDLSMRFYIGMNFAIQCSQMVGDRKR